VCAPPAPWWSTTNVPRKSTEWPFKPHASRKTAPTPVGLPDPDAAMDVFHAVLACLRTWLNQVLADLERVNGPPAAHAGAEGLRARLAELERVGEAWCHCAPCNRTTAPTTPDAP
jgi:hypothetical protein